MRVRLFGQYVHVSIAVLAAIEFVIFFGSMLLAYRIRYATWAPGEQWSYKSTLWICALVFAVANLISVLAFGLYSSRQRARTSGVFVRLVAAIGAASIVTAAVFFTILDLWIGRGVLLVSSFLALVGVGLSRGLFGRMMDESLLDRKSVV